MTFVTSSQENCHEKKAYRNRYAFPIIYLTFYHNVPRYNNTIILQYESLIRLYTAFLVSFAKNISFRVGFNTIKFTKNKPTNQANATPIVSTFNSKLSFVKKST